MKNRIGSVPAVDLKDKAEVVVGVEPVHAQQVLVDHGLFDLLVGQKLFDEFLEPQAVTVMKAGLAEHDVDALGKIAQRAQRESPKWRADLRHSQREDRVAAAHMQKLHVIGQIVVRDKKGVAAFCLHLMPGLRLDNGYHLFRQHPLLRLLVKGPRDLQRRVILAEQAEIPVEHQHRVSEKRFADRRQLLQRR